MAAVPVFVTSHGKILEYQLDEDWEEYIERMEFYFLSNDVDQEEKKRAILLANCGKQSYSLIKNLCAPAKPGVKS